MTAAATKLSAVFREFMVGTRTSGMNSSVSKYDSRRITEALAADLISAGVDPAGIRVEQRFRRLIDASPGRMGFGSGLVGRSPELFIARKPYQRAATLAQVVGLGFGLSLGIYMELKSLSGPRVGLATGIALGVSLGLIAGVLVGLWRSVVGAIAKPRIHTANPLSPRAVSRWDKRRGWNTGWCVGIGAGFGFWAALALTGAPANSVKTGVEVGIWTAILYALVYPISWLVTLAFLQLHMRYRTPVRLLKFLEDAHERDVLRMVGPVYQFRHARLQDRLAGQDGMLALRAQQPML